MRKAENIHDRDSLEAWLQTQPREVSLLIANRAALRVMPVWADDCLFGDGQKHDVTPVVILRANLISSVAALFPTDDMEAAARAARAAATADAGDVRATATATATATAAAVHAADAVLATATADVVLALAVFRTADAVDILPAAGEVWRAVRADALAIEAGEDVASAPLWPGKGPEANPLSDLWHKVARDGFTPDSPYDFWRRWYETLLDPTRHPPMSFDMLKDIALIAPEIWEGPPEDLAAEIARIEAGDRRAEKTDLAKAIYFDFIEVNKQLRMVGVEADFESLTDDQIAACLKRMREWAEELQDWRDYAQDEISGNRPSKLLRVVEKLLAQIAKDPSSEGFSARRYISLGSDLRHLSLDEKQRDSVGDTLAGMLDERIDELSNIAGGCFGGALKGLAPLTKVELGHNDPETLVENMQKGLDLIRQVDPAELAQVEPEGRAIIDEMVRELEEFIAAIEAAESPKMVALLHQRFAERYAGISTTVARSVEKGREVSGTFASKFDDAVKWFKRWEVLEKIIDWWESLLPPGP